MIDLDRPVVGHLNGLKQSEFFSKCYSRKPSNFSVLRRGWFC